MHPSHTWAPAFKRIFISKRMNVNQNGYPNTINTAPAFWIENILYCHIHHIAISSGCVVDVSERLILKTVRLMNGVSDLIDQSLSVYLAYSVNLNILRANTIVTCNNILQWIKIFCSLDEKYFISLPSLRRLARGQAAY